MMYYGKTPSQLFTKAHPQRVSKNFKKKNWIKKEFEPFKSESKEGESKIILLAYLETKKSFVVLRKDGEGIIFELEKTETLNINVLKLFKISLQKFE